MPKPPPHLEHWYAALASDHGICLLTSDRELLKARLYLARTAAADPDLTGLSIVFSPTDDSHLWIIKNDK